MRKFTWDTAKNSALRKYRNISFEQLLQAIENGGLVADQENPKRPNQRRLLVYCSDYIWVLPYVVEDDGAIFLKTAYPSRKLFKRYCKHEKN
jgi:uncharacterized DUF497 family protein